MKPPVAAIGIAVLLFAAACGAQGLKAPRNELEAGASRETLTNDRPDWSSVYIEGLHRLGERHLFHGGLRQTRRFGLDDTEAHGGLYYPLGAAWTGIVEANASPTHEVLARYSLHGQLHRQFTGGWGMAVGLRHSEYNTSATNILMLSAERYWGNFRAAYTLYSGRPEGASSAAAHRFQLSYYYSDRSSIGLSHTTGREVEYLGTQAGVFTSDVRDWTLSGRHWFSPNWALTYDLLTHEQGNIYRRQGLRLGVRHSF